LHCTAANVRFVPEADTQTLRAEGGKEGSGGR